jgi:hypothetical protein
MTPKEFQKRMGTLAKNIKVNVPKVVQMQLGLGLLKVRGFFSDNRAHRYRC